MSFVRAVELVRERAGAADAYPWSLPVVRNFERLELDPGVTFLVGENGSGKSTLIEALAVCLGLNPEGGTQNFAFATRESHSPLHEALRPVREARRPRTAFFLRAESLFTVATEIERLDELGPAPLLPSYGGRSDGLERADYDDLDHVRLTRSFLEDPQRFLRHLLDADD